MFDQRLRTVGPAEAREGYLHPLEPLRLALPKRGTDMQPTRATRRCHGGRKAPAANRPADASCRRFRSPPPLQEKYPAARRLAGSGDPVFTAETAYRSSGHHGVIVSSVRASARFRIAPHISCQRENDLRKCDRADDAEWLMSDTVDNPTISERRRLLLRELGVYAVELMRLLMFHKPLSNRIPLARFRRGVEECCSRSTVFEKDRPLI